MATPKKQKRDKWSLTLFIAGSQSSKSVAAYSNLKRICEEHLPAEYDLQVVDISLAPERAVEYQVLAIPMLLRREPPPSRRIIGDLSDTNKVLTSLGVAMRGASPACL